MMDSKNLLPETGHAFLLGRGDLDHLAAPFTVVLDRPAVQDVDEADPAPALDPGKVYGEDVAERLPQVLEQGEEVAPFVEFGDHDHAREVKTLGYGPGAFGPDLNPVRGAHRDHRAVGGGKGAANRGHEVGVARGVENKNFVPLVVDGQDRGTDREMMGFLLRRVVGGGGALFHRAHAVLAAGDEEQRFAQRGLSALAVSDERNRANHVVASFCVKYTWWDVLGSASRGRHGTPSGATPSRRIRVRRWGLWWGRTGVPASPGRCPTCILALKWAIAPSPGRSSRRSSGPSARGFRCWPFITRTPRGWPVRARPTGERRTGICPT